nr:immunoglobulin heavy chain junction region [Macaca mulatta]
CAREVMASGWFDVW